MIEKFTYTWLRYATAAFSRDFFGAKTLPKNTKTKTFLSRDPKQDCTHHLINILSSFRIISQLPPSSVLSAFCCPSPVRKMKIPK